MDAKDLLNFWFGELTDGFADAAHRQRWFESNAVFDNQCNTQFGTWLTEAKAGRLRHWVNEPRSCLAFIVLCDQLPRNIFRGSADAFAWDSLALDAAKHAVEQSFDQTMAFDERAFCYMPFEHSEDLLDQHMAVGLFSLLRDDSPKEHRQLTGGNLRFAQQHRDIILKYGRFPHRNAVLGRNSTQAELEFVAQGDGFGQSPAS